MRPPIATKCGPQHLELIDIKINIKILVEIFYSISGTESTPVSFLLSDIGCEFDSLPYYAEVHWLSCYSVLKRFWLLREEI
jgi:hypothetical protein